jgi:hypothetical protein
MLQAFGGAEALGISRAGAFGGRRGQKIGAGPKNILVIHPKARIYQIAQIARACGRVSVGGDPDKRPVNRRNQTGSRMRTGELRLKRRIAT